MRVVRFTPEVRHFFKTLIPVLYELGYFWHIEGSRKYVKELVDDIEDNLPTKVHKPAPPHFDQYGKDMHFATFRKNRHTVWYAFFTKYNDGGETIWLVRYIANNHTEAQYMP